MDLLSGYYQLLLREEDRHLTAFSTPSGHYEYIVTAQGLAGAPSTFNRFVQSTFASLKDVSRAFFDDLFVFTRSRDVQDHLDALDRVLKLCEERGITIKLSKCVFCRHEIPALGDFVGRETKSQSSRAASAQKRCSVKRIFGYHWILREVFEGLW